MKLEHFHNGKETLHCLQEITVEAAGVSPKEQKIMLNMFGLESFSELEKGNPITYLEWFVDALKVRYDRVLMLPDLAEGYENFIAKTSKDDDKFMMSFEGYAVQGQLIRDEFDTQLDEVKFKILSVTMLTPYLGNNVELAMRRDEAKALHMYFTGYRTTTTMIVGLCEYNMVTRGFTHDDDWVEVSREEGSLCDTAQETQAFDVVLHEGQQCYVEQDQGRTGNIWHFQNVNGKLQHKTVGGWSYGGYYIGDQEVSKEEYEDWVKYIS